MSRRLRLSAALNVARAIFAMMGAAACGIVEMRAITRDAVKLKYVRKPLTEAQLAELVHDRSWPPRHKTAQRTTRPAATQTQPGVGPVMPWSEPSPT